MTDRDTFAMPASFSGLITPKIINHVIFLLLFIDGSNVQCNFFNQILIFSQTDFINQKIDFRSPKC